MKDIISMVHEKRFEWISVITTYTGVNFVKYLNILKINHKCFDCKNMTWVNFD